MGGGELKAGSPPFYQPVRTGAAIPMTPSKTKPDDDLPELFVVLTLPDRSTVRFIVEESLSIGRAPDCGIRLDDPLVLPYHATIHRQEHGLFLEKAPGPAMVRVNGLPTAGRLLSSGDEIQVGRSLLTVGSSRRLFKTLEDLAYDSRRGTRSDGMTRADEPVTAKPGRDERGDDLLEDLHLDENITFESLLTSPVSPGVSEDNPLRFLLEAERENRASFDPLERVRQRMGTLTTDHPPDPKAPWLGGYAGFKSWVTQGQRTIQVQGRYGPPAPRGVFLLGPSGCGKKRAVRALAYLWKVPVTQIHLGRVLESPSWDWPTLLPAVFRLVGQRSPRLIMLADIDRAFREASEKLGRRNEALELYTLLLKILDKLPDSILIGLTGSDPRWIHKALLTRGGPITEAFLVDLPDSRTRGEILAVLLAAEGEKVRDLDMNRLIEVTNGFRGGDLAKVIGSARRIRNGQPLRTQDLETSAARHTASHDDLRDWPAMRALCRKLCIPA